jgi:DNA invertase Pin-like site-specific DNA recombinase
MTVHGYARVSTDDQSLDIQIAALQAAGCEKIRSEKQSGTTTNGRQELKTLLDFIDAGDVLMVTQDRPPGPQHWRPAGHCPRLEGQERRVTGY